MLVNIILTQRYDCVARVEFTISSRRSQVPPWAMIPQTVKFAAISPSDIS